MLEARNLAEVINEMECRIAMIRSFLADGVPDVPQENRLMAELRRLNSWVKPLKEIK